MNKNDQNQDNTDDGNLYGIQKITWEIYGVKRFPYRGKRKFTPLLQQSLDGGMVISNDVFGLTILQFERKYKACLERRKTNEQWILNLRYPDKSSKDYLEYLENCTDCSTDKCLWIKQDIREKHLYKQLVHIVGTELEIRKRQRMCIIIDMIANTCVSNPTYISSGSLAEGLNLPGSDKDVMYVINHIDVVPNLVDIKYPIQPTTCVMETDIDHPGFTKLRLLEMKAVGATIKHKCQCSSGSCNRKKYLTVKDFPEKNAQDRWGEPLSSHGPCWSNREQSIDISFCLRSRYRHRHAITWAGRHRQQWPPNIVIDRIIKSGCLLVPIGPKTLPDNRFLWRLSFSIAEKILVHSFNFTQLLCYGLLKLMVTRIVDSQNEVKDLLCSYFLKTALFWVSEEVNINAFHVTKISYCFSLCLDKMISWIKTCYCPNYFIPEQNMFLGKINQNNNNILLGVLESIMCRGIYGLINNLFAIHDATHYFFNTNYTPSFIILDFLLIHMSGNILQVDFGHTRILKYYKGLAVAEYLIKSESSSFIIDLCKYVFGKISQIIAQSLSAPNKIGRMYNTRNSYYRYLKNGLKIDAVSGWLLFASFFYVTGQFNVTLKLTDYVLSRCSIDMINTNVVTEECVERYRHNVHASMTLNERLTLTTAANVMYVPRSSLIPEELQLENDVHFFSIPYLVMCYCLRCLCYHHTGDIFNRQQALHDLHLTVNNVRRISEHELSNSLTIVGVCNEIAGHEDNAYQCYNLASLYQICECAKAEKRKSKLVDI